MNERCPKCGKVDFEIKKKNGEYVRKCRKCGYEWSSPDYKKRNIPIINEECPICGGRDFLYSGIEDDCHVFECADCGVPFFIPVSDSNEKRKIKKPDSKIHCPVCYSTNIRKFSRKYSNLKYICNECSHVFGDEDIIREEKDADSEEYFSWNPKSKESEEEIFDSGINILEKPQIIVPHYILQVCSSIQKKVGSDEFSILVKGRWEDGEFHLTNEFVIPKQEVSSASVDYKDDMVKYKQEGYNVIIHSHPFARKSTFSHVDKEYINSNFDYSLLYCEDGFTDASMLVKIDDSHKISIKPDVRIVEDEIEVDISNISKKQTHWSSKKHNRYPDRFYPIYTGVSPYY